VDMAFENVLEKEKRPALFCAGRSRNFFLGGLRRNFSSLPDSGVTVGTSNTH
jgi:hypothetical protein